MSAFSLGFMHCLAQEWHPFSIASATQDDHVRLCIKTMGDGTWTQRLFDLVEEHGRDFSVLWRLAF
jgi:predicted ferric reductase